MNIPAITRHATPLLAATCLMAWVHTSPAADQASIVILPDADTRLMNPKLFSNKGITDPEPAGQLTKMGVPACRDRSLIQFALSDIPKNAKIQRATLELTVSTGYQNNNCPSSIYRITKPWDELSANWNSADSATKWDAPGGDAAGEDGQPFGSPYATNEEGFQSTKDSPPTKIEWDITNLVNEWLSGKSPNHGLMIKTDQPKNTLEFYTKEEKNDSYRPVLKIELAK